MPTNTSIGARSLFVLTLAACGGADSSDAVGDTTELPVVTSTLAATPVTTTTPPTTAPTTTTAPPTTASVTTTVAARREAIATELELLSIVSIGVGAGSGEVDIVIAERPEGLERFKVSTAGSDGACNARILDVRYTAGGAVVTVDPSPDPDQPCGGSTFGVAWVHVDGRRSGITYRTCSAGITLTQDC